MTVTSIATLKSTNGAAPNEYSHVLGYYTPGDGGGGAFYWDDAATDAEDGIVTIKAPNATGRWKRLHMHIIDVKWAGAKGDGTTNDITAVQQAIDFCSQNGYTLKLSPGTYLCNGSLWLKDNTVITGAGSISVLKIGASGQIRGEKGGVRNYGFSTKYLDEIIPANGEDYDNVLLTTDVAKGSVTLPVASTTQVNIGDVVYTYNDFGDAWAILENVAFSAEWNNYDNPLAQMEVFTVVAKTTTTVTLNRPTLFDCPKDAPFRKLIGVRDVWLSDFKVEFVAEVQNGILLEQIRNCRIDKLVLQNGGIALMNKSAWSTVTNCTITTNTYRCIVVDAFSTGNRISNNTCNYTHGGDAAILVMMSNNNSVCNNTVEGSGGRPLDELGICCHARSYNNVFVGNVVRNMAEGYGLYFGCWANTFHANSSAKCFVDYSVYYAGKATISGAVSFGTSEIRDNIVLPPDPPGTIRLKRSLSIFGSRDIVVTDGIFEKNMLIQATKNVVIANNTLQGDLTLIPDLSDAGPVIRNNRIISTGKCISVMVPVYNTTAPYTPILIEGNYLEGNADRLIYIQRAVHVYIRHNTIKANDHIGVGFNDVASFTAITNNHFMDCAVAVDFSATPGSNVSTSYAAVKDNQFFNCTTMYQSWVSPVNNSFIGKCGVNGFEIMNLAATVPVTPDKKWVYIAAADGQTGAANWKEITL
ncbi:hypothetical protein F0L74_07360 [Chitinophaga agrisoli]|uniref:Parallel beta helix pectate lyase-like protein n=1 Tax=Chitinophaga agrisoli TaxID=2607653 RepID=A0A5B2W298_9BACT|nr:right-handed parallel beta-helix repeat-containing protein [Chitinophaga agrisoli]KAA2245761.1 hypothetical protein F0L74_07360 [Chitinophaga agrisoli]